MKRRRIRLVYKKYHPEVREIIEGVISKWSKRSIDEKFDGNRAILARVHGCVAGRKKQIIEAYFYACSRDEDKEFEVPANGIFFTDQYGNTKYITNETQIARAIG